MKNLKLTFCLIVLATLSVSGFSQTAKTTTSLVEDLPDDGVVSGSTYSNKYFGLTLTIPVGWEVKGQSTKQEIKDRGKSLMTSDDPAKREQLNKAVDNTLNLLTLSQTQVGVNAGFNPLLLVVAEKLPGGAMTDSEYLSALKRAFQYSTVPVTIVKDIYPESVGGTVFSVIETSVDFKGVIVRQRYYVHVKKGYALGFIISFQTEDQLRAQEGLVRSAVLR